MSGTVYEKVIIGEMIEEGLYDNERLLPTATTASTSPSASSFPTAYVVHNGFVAQRPPAPPHPRWQRGYGTYGRPPPHHFASPPHIHEDGEECALVGCIFSWIPLVGFITYAVHWPAPYYSRRAFWARTALTISLVVLIMNVIYWSTTTKKH